MTSSSAMGLKKGPWIPEEDSKLVASVSVHGVGRWNSLAQSAGLQRSGKSCRLRWLNYLRPNVRHGGFTLEEQRLILQLHYRWGNKWAKIAEQLPGRTDNDIKNYWRTRVLKQAKHLNCDVNSPVFKEAIHHIWIPGIEDRIKFGSGYSAGQKSRIPVDSPASECVEKKGGVNGEGHEAGSVGVEANPFEWGYDQSLERVPTDEDISCLHHLLFDTI